MLSGLHKVVLGSCAYCTPFIGCSGQIGSNRYLHLRLLHPPPKRTNHGALILSHHALEKHDHDLQHGEQCRCPAHGGQSRVHFPTQCHQNIEARIATILFEQSIPSLAASPTACISRLGPSFLHRSRPGSRCKGVPDSTM